MNKIATALFIVGSTLSVGLFADGGQDDEPTISRDIEERLESDDLGTRWEAAGDYLDRLDELDGGVPNRFD